ncbi:DUF6082 family protein [Microtetraspora malaysiensis]|uniref:DUF6082 family protein n=1 Tax=Microtetraspora malaysiensis TaxID=161358 RepID=UPI003D92A5DC
MVQPKHRDRISRAVLPTVAVLTVTGSTLITLGSPFLLKRLGSAPGLDWVTLSNIGQTYGAASALLSALALIGVSWSLYLQSRESLALRKDSERNQHFHLLQLAIENPALLKGEGFPTKRELGYDPRVHLYFNLVISFWEMMYEVGEMPEQILREYVKADLLWATPGRRFWERTRNQRLKSAKNKRQSEFWAIVDSEWKEAHERWGSPGSTAKRGDNQKLLPAILISCSLGVGMTTGWLAARKRKRQ